MVQTFNSIPFAKSSQISGLAEVKAQIKRLNAAKLNVDAPFEQLDHLINKVIKLQVPNFLHPNTSFFVSEKAAGVIAKLASEQNSLPFYRIRTVKDFRQDPLLITSHSVPPAAFTSRGRANIANYPVLYLSLLPQTAAYEMKVRPGEQIYLSVWKAKKGAYFNLISYFLVHDMLPAKWSKIATKLKMKIDEKLCMYDRDERRAVKHIIESLQKWYLRKDDYILSSYLSHNILYRADLSSYGLTCDCILYPSVADKLNSVNLAFGPSAFSKLEIEKVIKLRVTTISETDLQGDLLGIARPNTESSMQWLKELEREAVRDENISIRKVYF